jgi:hypothetical protein
MVNSDITYSIINLYPVNTKDISSMEVDMEIGEHWETIRNIFEQAFPSCMHYAFATVNERGEPNVTPIGALVLRPDRTGFYFEEYPVHLPANIEKNNRVCVLAVNANLQFWGKALTEGKFETPPAVRLYGAVGDRRPATQEEINAFLDKLKMVKETKGYKLLWEKMKTVRDIQFDSFEPVLTGEMTRDLW